MKILVTGGKGFIGSHVVHELILECHEVYVIDNNKAGVYVEGAEYITFDMSKTEVELNRILFWIHPEIIIHLAAWSNVRESMMNPAQLYETNILSTANLVQALTAHNDTIQCHHVIFASSSAALSPESHYGASKRAGELMLEVMHNQTGIPVCCLRFGNVYGVRQNPANGTLIAKTIERGLQGKPPIIFGNGDQTRDYICVDDLVRAIRIVKNARITGIHNVCSGKSHTTYEVVSMIRYALDANLHGDELPPTAYRAAQSGEKQYVTMVPSETLERYWTACVSTGQGIKNQLLWRLEDEKPKTVLWDKPMNVTGDRMKPPAHHCTPVNTFQEWRNIKRNTRSSRTDSLVL
jgi:UDP-glucose 4-epimerase